MNALRAALRIFSGKKILNFGFQKSLRTFLKPIFTGRGLGSEHHMLSLAPCGSERGGHLNLYPYKKRLPHAIAQQSL